MSSQTSGECPECGKEFSTNGSMLRHYRSTHEDQDSVPPGLVYEKIQVQASKNERVSRQFLEECRKGRSWHVHVCLSHGADVNAIYQYGRFITTGLMVACQLGHSSVVARLVNEQNLNVNFQDENGATAACLAVNLGLTECISALTRVDTVDWTKADNNGFTPLYWALHHGNTKIVDIIVSQSNINYNVMTNAGYTLSDAALGPRRGQLRRHIIEPYWRTPARVDFMKMLARQEKYNNWNVADIDGDTPIMKAVKRNQSEIIEILLKCPRVDLDAVDRRRNWLETVTTDTLILDKLRTFRSVLQRSILRDSHLIRQAGKVSKLQSLTRDTVLLSLSANNTRERLVKPLVDRLEGELPAILMDFLKAPYSERDLKVTTQQTNGNWWSREIRWISGDL